MLQNYIIGLVKPLSTVEFTSVANVIHSKLVHSWLNSWPLYCCTLFTLLSVGSSVLQDIGHRAREVQVILYSVQCYALHWTYNKY